MDQVSCACVQSINCGMTTGPTPGPFRKKEIIIYRKLREEAFAHAACHVLGT
jgi:hypothetical protein